MTDPQPVIVAGTTEPVPVVVTYPTASVATAIRRDDEKDRTSLGQRRVNLIWEITQAAIALAVTLTTLYAAATIVTRATIDAAAFLLLSNAFFLVIGFYFGRTNHARTGGPGGETVPYDR